MKRVIVVLLVFIMIFTLAACNGSGGDSSGGGGGSAKKIMFAHWYAEDHPQHLAILRFKELIEERTDGAITVEIYPNSQLGSEDTFIDSVKQGTVQMGSCGTMVSKFDEKIAAAEIPFLFNGWDDAEAVFTGEVGANLTADLPDLAGLRVTATTVNGFRQFSSTKDMSTLGDISGQRFRVPNVPHYLQMVTAMGANPIAMSLTEVFQALEQNTVDGQENPYATIKTSSMYEVQNYILESNHMFSPAFWIINDAFYLGLSDEEREAFDSSIKEAEAYNWVISKEQEAADKKSLIDYGLEVIVPSDSYKEELRDTQTEVYQWFYDNHAGSEEFVNQVRALQDTM